MALSRAALGVGAVLKPVSASEMRPLTQRQLLFWLGQQRYPQLPLYNMVSEIDIDGAVHVQSFSRAFAALVDASDALRSVFVEVRGEVTRGVLSQIEPGLAFVDLSEQADPNAARVEYLNQRSAECFDLSTRCFEAALLKLHERHYVWWLCQHHLIGDGASLGVLYRNLARCYEQGGEPLVLGSADEARVQEDAYKLSSRYERDLGFWEQRQRSVLERTRPYAGPRVEPAYFVERLTRVLDERQSARLREIAHRAGGMTTFADVQASALLETVLFAYLHRVTGRAEQALGTPVRNRQSQAAKNASGCFLEVLPIQVEVAAEDTFASLFARVLSSTLAALSHGQCCVLNSEHRSLFDVTLNYHTEKYAPLGDAPVRMTLRTGMHCRSRQAQDAASAALVAESLVLHCHDFSAQDRLTLWFDFNAAYFDGAQRERAAGHLMALLDAALQNFDATIAEVEIVGPEEREWLLRCNPPASVGDARDTLVSRFEAQVARAPERSAVSFAGAGLSYGELDRRATQLAIRLRELGVGPNVLVGTYLQRSLDLPVGLLAILKAGGAYVPIDPSHPVARNAVVLEDAAPVVVITQRALVERLAAGGTRQILCIDEIEWQSGAQPRLPSPDARQLAYVLFTSGSSGRPKGVAIEHGALANFLESMRETPGAGPHDRCLAITTISFDIAALELYLPLTTGGTVLLADSATAADPQRLAALIRAQRPTIVQATPTTWQMLLEAGWAGDIGLKALCGGEPLSGDLARELAACVGTLWNMYGPTETTVWSSLQRVERGAVVPIAIGRPIRNTVIHILNASSRLAPIGVVGEICIGGAGVARGYHGRPDLTHNRFVADPYGAAGDRIYRTGDLGRRRADGTIECLGRSDLQVKIRGHRVELAEIESALLAHPAIAGACVAARELRADEKTLVAFVVARAGAHAGHEQLRAFVAERLPQYMVPSLFVDLEALPLTPNGKVDRNALPDPKVEVSDRHEPPANDLEARVAALFEQLLGVSPIGRRDNFFDLGGHSILAARLVIALQDFSAVSLGIGVIFQRATVAGIAEAIRDGGVLDTAWVMPLNSDNARNDLPVFCICGIQLYKELAQAIGDEHPVLGVFLPAEEHAIAQAQTTGEVLSVEALADGYLAAIRAKQPCGPYSLIGASFGGVLAYVMAQKLEAAGEKVALLALIDTTLPRAVHRKPWRWLIAHARGLLDEGPSYASERVARMFERARHFLPLAGRGRSLPPLPPTISARMAAYRAATLSYDPELRSYGGPAIVFCATDRNEFEGDIVDPHLGWGSLVRALEVRQTRGTHLSMLRLPHVKELAETLRERLAKARARPEHETEGKPPR